MATVLCVCHFVAFGEKNKFDFHYLLWSLSWMLGGLVFFPVFHIILHELITFMIQTLHLHLTFLDLNITPDNGP